MDEPTTQRSDGSAAPPEDAAVHGLISEWSAQRESFKRLREAQDVEYNYALKLQQHKDTNTNNPLAPKPMRVVSLDLYDNIRYSSAVIGGTEIYLDVRPAEGGKTDAENLENDEAAEIMQAAMLGEVTDIEKGYPRIRRRFIRMSVAARQGAAKLDVVPGGPHGVEIVPRETDPGALTWDPRFIHFNDYGCPVLWETFRLPVEVIRRNKDWKNTELVVPDDGEKAYPPKAEPTVDQKSYELHKGRATLAVGWLKEEVLEAPEPRPDIPLPPRKWYMACSKCGYTEQDATDDEGYDGSQLPEQLPCPQCGVTPEGMPVALMDRIEAEDDFSSPKLKVRHRRVVIAPFSPGAGLLRDGDWPAGLTNFPYILHVSDPFPLEQGGNSQTSLNMDLQSLKNESLRVGFEQMDRNRDLLLVKEDALWDANHEPFVYGGGDFVAYVSDYESLRGIQHFQGSGLNVAFPMWMDRMDRELGTHRGTGQFSVRAEEMKGTPVGTVQRSQETGDVPLDEQIKILREDEEQFFMRWLELLCAYWDENRWIEWNAKSGARVFRLLKGTEMPALKLKVTAAPDMSAVDSKVIQSVTALKDASPATIRWAGKAAHLPLSLIEDLVRESAWQPAGAGTGTIPSSPTGISPAGQ